MRLFTGFILAVVLSCVTSTGAQELGRAPRQDPSPQSPIGAAHVAAIGDVIQDNLARTVKVFDFEERAAGNFEPLPMGWVKVEGDGLPHYVNGRLDRARPHTGDWAFRFDLNGGNLIYRYPAGQIRVAAGSSYRADVWVSTTPLRHARARLIAFFCDIDGRPLPQTIIRSELFASDAATTWKQLRVELRASDPRAYSVAVELQLLQPERFSQSTLGGQTLFAQDITGSAWFDNLRVAQVPQVSVKTAHPGNIFFDEDSLTLVVRVVDQVLTDLDAKLEVIDSLGNVVHQRSGPLTRERNPNPAERDIRAAIELPQLRAGHYTAKLSLSANGQFVGERALEFIRLPPSASRQGVIRDPRITLATSNLPADSFEELAGVLDKMGAGRAKVSVWTATADIASDFGPQFDRFLEQLGESNIAITASLDALPPSVVAKAGRDIQPDNWSELSRLPADRWQPQLAYLVSRHASRIGTWQLLPDESAQRFAQEPAMRRAYERLLAEFGQLLGKPPLAMPWPAWYSVEDANPESLNLVVPSMILPSQLELYALEATKESGSRPVSLRLEPVSEATYGRETRLRDWAQRITFALATSNIERVELPLPFVLSNDIANGTPGFNPNELALVTRAVLLQLAGSTYQGKMPVAPNVEAHCFEREGKGVIVLWNTDNTSDASPRELNIELGHRAKRQDIFGNDLPLTRDAKDTAWQFSLGSMPQIIVDAEPALARFRASFAVDNPMLESSFEPHSRTLRVTNTFKEPIVGSIRITGPSGWSVVVANPSFNLSPGDTFTTPITLEFPFASNAGEKLLRARIRIDSRDSYQLDLPVAMQLGLSDVGMQTLAVRQGNDLFVQQMITNYGTIPINYTAFIQCPGLPRQERLVGELLPGKTTIRKYRLTGVATDVAKLRSGLREMDGVRVLNQEVDVR